jgi:hypothetical protein
MEYYSCASSVYPSNDRNHARVDPNMGTVYDGDGGVACMDWSSPLHVVDA